jgi:hypothetical protein
MILITENWCPFHQRFTRSFYEQRSEKRKKTLMTCASKHFLLSFTANANANQNDYANVNLNANANQNGNHLNY